MPDGHIRHCGRACPVPPHGFARRPGQSTGFKGPGNVALGRFGDAPYDYIATVEPFHGTAVTVYSEDAGSTLTDLSWKRTILDLFGDPNEARKGPGHRLVTADFDGAGVVVHGRADRRSGPRRRRATRLRHHRVLHAPYTVRTDDALMFRLSAMLGEEPEIDVALV